MLDEQRLTLAVDLHAKSYGLLGWLSAAVETGLIRLEKAHEFMDLHDVAHDWLTVHYLNIPPAHRPAKEHLETFARFFSTYLTTSFDLVKNPKSQIKMWCGCFCPWCSYVAAAPHLQVKKLSKKDKERAERLKVQSLMQLALDHGVTLTENVAVTLAGKDAMREALALVAYGEQLLLRMQGLSDGPAVLALWRQFAWNTSGSPKKGFRLAAFMMLRA